MIFQVVAMMVLEGQIASVFNSPFVIPVAGCIMILGMSVGSMWAKVRSEEIKSHERLARIAQGLPVEPEIPGASAPVSAMESVFGNASTAAGTAPRADRMNDGGKARRAGIVLTSVGVGLFAFFAALAAIVQVREVLSGGVAGLIPLAIGIGFLIDARLKRSEYERYREWERFGGAATPAGAVTGSVPPPPPPPAGMSAAQASDWRPLH